MAESCLGILSIIGQFLVIFFLKLRGAHVAPKKINSYLLKFLCTLAISLALADILREEYDQDENFFKQLDSNLIIFFDLFYPLCVDFRLHSAIMLLYVVLEHSQKQKEEKERSSRGVGTNQSAPHSQERDQQAPTLPE